MKKSLLFFTFLVTFFLYSQENKDSIPQVLKGQILDVKTKFPLKSAHILNLTSVKGTTTNGYGRFEIKAKKGDEIYISYIGYESVKLIVTHDLLNNKDLKIAIHDRIVPLDEVEVKSHHLIGVLAVDAKNVPQSLPNRLHINGLPQTYETGLPQQRNYNSALAAVFSPL
ncbi:MAG TPA: carboxypeptidase-like regulatory domain-containing protein, partial [Flavobacteriia bacterium]|nr:carboxypeptidase-like regulatory domain-containing protein [Flavobacteriia bacterium]